MGLRIMGFGTMACSWWSASITMHHYPFCAVRLFKVSRRDVRKRLVESDWLGRGGGGVKFVIGRWGNFAVKLEVKKRKKGL